LFFIKLSFPLQVQQLQTTTTIMSYSAYQTPSLPSQARVPVPAPGQTEYQPPPMPSQAQVKKLVEYLVDLQYQIKRILPPENDRLTPEMQDLIDLAQTFESDITVALHTDTTKDIDRANKSGVIAFNKLTELKMSQDAARELIRATKNNEFQNMKAENSKLRDENDELVRINKENCEHFYSDNDRLRAENDRLRAENDRLRADFDRLGAKYDELTHINEENCEHYYSENDRLGAVIRDLEGQLRDLQDQTRVDELI